MMPNKPELVSETAHALRKALNIILNNSGFILRKIEPELLMEDVQEIHEAAQQLTGLLNEVIEILGINHRDYRVTALNLTEIIEMECSQAATLAPNKRFISRGNPDLPKIWADGEAIRRIVGLLMGNVISFSQSDVIYVDIYAEDQAVIVKIGGTALEDSHIVELPPMRRKGKHGLDLLLCYCLLEIQHGQFWATADEQNGDISLNCLLPTALPAQ